MMPFDRHKYSGLDYYWRMSMIAFFTMGPTTLLTYPFDLFHTRMAADLTKKG